MQICLWKLLYIIRDTFCALRFLTTLRFAWTSLWPLRLTRKKLDRICAECGLSELASKLPKGYDTQVVKFVDDEGFESSSGEDQRIAIARTCYQGGDIYVLDEPTVSIDPMAENEIYTQFHRMIQDHCAILITHRLSAVKLADNIAVFDGGQHSWIWHASWTVC